VLAAILLAIGLAMDAAAASAVRGMLAREVRPRDVATCAGLTGGFQAGMAALGWAAGQRFGHVVAQVDHWIAFAILMALGGKALWAAWRGGDGDDDPAAVAHPFAVRGLVVLAIATSIDALAAGVTIPLMSVPGPVVIALIGGVTAVLSIAAIRVGRAVGAHLGQRLEIVGGLALCAIGVKILVEHLTGGA
jgi:putative Mn2+ efflux pump MntP